MVILIPAHLVPPAAPAVLSADTAATSPRTAQQYKIPRKLWKITVEPRQRDAEKKAEEARRKHGEIIIIGDI